MDLDRHRYSTIVRDSSASSTDCTFGLRSSILMRARSVFSLIVKWGQVLSMLYNNWRLMRVCVPVATKFLWINLVTLLILRLLLDRLLLLLLDLLLLLELLLPLGVHLLLDCDVVLGRCTLLFSLAKDKRWVDGIRAIDVLTVVYVSKHASLTVIVLSCHVVRWTWTDILLMLIICILTIS